MKFPPFKDLILFENDDLVVVNKPAMLSSVDERYDGENNLLKMAKHHYPDAQACHRLDKETSGCLIIAKNPETYRIISMQFEHRNIKKIYHAIIDGTFVFENLHIKLPILNLGKGNVVIDKKEGKSAETIFNSIRFFKHHTLVECMPITGRMHQIRVHLASQRASITGDVMYKGKPLYLSHLKKKYKLSAEEEEQPIMKRFALHAREITFSLREVHKNEIDQIEFITVQAPYPKDFATALKMLEKFDS